MLTHRHAVEADLADLRALMALAIDGLQRAFLSEAQIAASREVMGLDTQLIADRTYFLIEEGGMLAGCGGWSYRATTHGGDHSAGLRNATPLDPATEPARIRAMYTHPDFARRGVGRLVLRLCEDAARAAGFRRAMMMATLAGEKLYTACGYAIEAEVVQNVVPGVPVPLWRMSKSLSPMV